LGLPVCAYIDIEDNSIRQKKANRIEGMNLLLIINSQMD